MERVVIWFDENQRENNSKRGPGRQVDFVKTKSFLCKFLWTGKVRVRVHFDKFVGFFIKIPKSLIDGARLWVDFTKGKQLFREKKN